MKRGDRGEYVKILQNQLGSIQADGIYGLATETYVKQWQTENGLGADGVFGPKSWSKLLGVEITKTNRKITEVIIHCTASKEGQSMTVYQIDKLHRKNGWAGIGYHYVIYLDGTIHLGRAVHKVGAHCTNHNANSIGICYVGGLDKVLKKKDGSPAAKDTRTKEQKEAMLVLLACMRDLYPQANILGHRDTSKDLNNNGRIDKWEWVKDCPCFDVKSEYTL